MQDGAKDAHSAAMRADFELPVGGASLRASVRLPPGQSNLTKLLPIIQQLENIILDRIGEEAKRAGRPITCRAGCGACCRQMVPVSLFEAEALMEWVRTLPEERRRVLEERFHRALVALRDAGVIESLLSERWMEDEASTTRLAIDYFHAGVACPFLEEESCSIHAIRPLSCREYVVTSPAELCKDPSIHHVSGLDLPLKLSKGLYAFGQQVAQDRRGWIPLVFLLGWGQSGASPGEYISGTSEEILRRFLERVAEVQQKGESPAA